MRHACAARHPGPSLGAHARPPHRVKRCRTGGTGNRRPLTRCWGASSARHAPALDSPRHASSPNATLTRASWPAADLARAAQGAPRHAPARPPSRPAGAARHGHRTGALRRGTATLDAVGRTLGTLGTRKHMATYGNLLSTRNHVFAYMCGVRQVTRSDPIHPQPTRRSGRAHARRTGMASPCLTGLTLPAPPTSPGWAPERAAL